MESNVYLFMLGIFAVAFVVGLVFSIGAERLSRGNLVHRGIFYRYGAWAAWLGGVGMTIIGLRYLNIPAFSKRAWSVIDMIALFGVGLHLIWYSFKQYPSEMADYREEERRRRFLPTPRRARRRR